MAEYNRKTADTPRTWGNRQLGTSTRKTGGDGTPRRATQAAQASRTAQPNRAAQASPAGQWANPSRSSSANHPTSHRKVAPAQSHRPERGGSHRPDRSGGRSRRRSKHPIIKWFFIILGLLIVLGMAGLAYLYASTDIPSPEQVALAQKTNVYYADGTTKIGTFATQNREIVPCAAIPPAMENAIVASEDQTFWTNNGVDLKGIVRALLNNVTGGARQGASTITQQYAKQYYLGNATSYLGKLRQAFTALKITQTQNKQTILCNYLNTIYFGRGAYGIQAAAQAYFGKDAKDLDYSQSAMLAGIVPAPTYWDPAVSLQQAQNRWKRTLRIMKANRYINTDQFDKASFPATIAPKPADNMYAGSNGYLLSMVKTELTTNKTFTDEELQTGGYKIVTTLNPTLQQTMQTVGQTHLYGVPASVQQGGISVDPRDGSVYAVYAGTDYLKHPLNAATQAQFEPGSTMKPFALLAAAKAGVSFNTVFNGNSPQTFKGLQRSVSNDEGISYGYINLYTALDYSVNTAFMALNEQLTPQVTAKTAHDAGITSDIDANSPYNVLGINGITAWQLAQGYSTIANQGLRPTLHVVKSVTNSAGQNLYNAPTRTVRAFPASTVALVTKAMRGVVTSGTAKEASSLRLPVAGKTGTANDGKAVSFVGLTPQMVTVFGVWNPDAKGNPQELPSYFGYYHGSAYPVHLFTLYSQQAFQGLPWAQFPDAVDTGSVGGPNGTFGVGNYRKSE